MVILCLSIQLSHSVMSDSLQLHEWQHAGLPCPSPTPGAYSNSCPSSRWCHPTVLLSVVPFSSRLQSFPASGSCVLCLYTWLKLHEAVYLIYVCLVHNYVFLFKNNKKITFEIGVPEVVSPSLWKWNYTLICGGKPTNWLFGLRVLVKVFPIHFIYWELFSSSFSAHTLKFIVACKWNPSCLPRPTCSLSLIWWVLVQNVLGVTKERILNVTFHKKSSARKKAWLWNSIVLYELCGL